jgi:hypothetical protein
MRAGRTPPFVRADKRAFSMQDWRLVGGRALQDEALIPEWDQSLTLVMTRILEVDMRFLAGSGTLMPGAQLALIPSWWSEGTGLRGRGESHVVTIGTHGSRLHRFELNLSIPGRELSGRLQMRSSLVLMEPTSEMMKSRIAPHRPGSILWDDSTTIILQGQAARFPISIVDFAGSALGPENACWCFDWSPADVMLPAMATMRLYLNSRHPFFHSAAVTQEPSPAQIAARSTLKYCVAEEMIRLALDHAEELEGCAEDFSPASSGRVLTDLLHRVFPGASPIACRERRTKEPGMFQADIQARMALFGSKILEGVEA